MLELRRLSGLSRKPLLAQAGELNTADLECLRDSGVAAVQIEGGKNLSKRLGALRKQIEAMPPRRRRRNDRQEAVPLLPNVSHGGDDEGDDEE